MPPRAVAGGLIGNSLDQQQQQRLRQQSPQTYTRVDQGQPLDLGGGPPGLSASSPCRLGSRLLVTGAAGLVPDSRTLALTVAPGGL
jgi:hypothetical protein